MLQSNLELSILLWINAFFNFKIKLFQKYLKIHLNLIRLNKSKVIKYGRIKTPTSIYMPCYFPANVFLIKHPKHPLTRHHFKNRNRCIERQTRDYLQANERMKVVGDPKVCITCKT